MPVKLAKGEIWCTRCDLNPAPDAGHGECSTCSTKRERGDLPFDERPDVYECTSDGDPT